MCDCAPAPASAGGGGDFVVCRAPTAGPRHDGQMTTSDVEIPPGRVVCWECTGTGAAPNPYAHECSGPLCQDPPTLECPTCDGLGHTTADA